MPEPKFSLFVSSVKGHTVTRYGTRQFIGCARNPQPDPNDATAVAAWVPYSWNTEQVIPLTEAEATRYGKEYGKEIVGERLTKRTETDWLACLDAEKTANEAKVARVKAVADKAKADTTAQEAPVEKPASRGNTQPIAAAK